MICQYGNIVVLLAIIHRADIVTCVRYLRSPPRPPHHSTNHMGHQLSTIRTVRHFHPLSKIGMKTPLRSSPTVWNTQQDEERKFMPYVYAIFCCFWQTAPRSFKFPGKLFWVAFKLCILHRLENMRLVPTNITIDIIAPATVAIQQSVGPST